MPLDEATATAVTGGDSPSGADESTSAAPAPGGDEGIQTPDAGETPVVAAEPAPADSPEESATPSLDDVLKSIPADDSDLEQANTRDVVGLRNQRAQLRVLESAVKELQPLEAFKEFTQLGEPETIKSKVEAYDQLFTPVVNPETNQPELDPQTGFPRITATPFIERVDAENPGMAEQLLFDALNYRADFGDGQKLALYQHPAVQAELLRACGLDPTRADDYRNIDALSAPQDTGAITPEELEAIPAELHEAYKSLSPDVRSDVKNASAAAREQYLRDRQEVLEAKQAREVQARESAAQRQQQETAARQYVAEQQEAFVGQQIQEGYAQIMDALASQVTFSGEAGTNEFMHGMIGSYLLTLRDPDSRFITEKTLNALGVKVEPNFYESLGAADQLYREAKAYELFGQQGMKQKALTEANRAKTQVIAKLSTIALKAAKALGGQVQARAAAQGQSLTDATRTRPVPSDTSSTGETSGLLPEGVRANSPEAGKILWRQIQAQHAQGG